MLRERLRIFSVCAARDGISDSVRSPCAIVLPPGNSRRGALDVDMNPVVVADEAGEAVDLRLVDGDPVAGSELLADVKPHVGGSTDFNHRASLPPVRANPGRGPAIDIAPGALGEIGQNRPDRL